MSQVQVALAPFDSTRHGERLRGWLHQPHVRRWRGDPEEVMRAVQEGTEAAEEALILADATPVGYLRWQRAPRADLDAAGLHDIPDAAVDIDILIGEPAGIGRGIGPEALRLLVQRLRRDPSIPLACLGASVDNPAAIRAYEKAGFERLREFDDPEWGPCCILVVRLRDDAAV